MADEPSNPAPLGEIEHGPSKFEQFLDQNQKKLIIGILVLIAGISAAIVVRGLREQEDNSAGEALTAAGDATSTYDLAALRDVIDNFKDSPASGSAAVLLAEEQWQDNRRDEAIETLRGFIADNPEHAARPTALMALGLHLLEQDKTEEASSTLQQVVDSPNGSHLAPFALLTLGDLKKGTGDNDAAKALYEQADQNYPNNSPSMKQFINQRISLIGVEPPTKIAPPPVDPPATTPTPPIPPTPTPGGGGLFPELNNPTPAIPGIPAGGIPGMPAGGIPGTPTSPTPPTPTEPGTEGTNPPSDPTPPTPPAPTEPDTPADTSDPAPADTSDPAATDTNTPSEPAPTEPETPANDDSNEGSTAGSTPAGDDSSPSGPTEPDSEENETP